VLIAEKKMKRQNRDKCLFDLENFVMSYDSKLKKYRGCRFKKYLFDNIFFILSAKHNTKLVLFGERTKTYKNSLMCESQM